ncbi:rubredoxin [Persephonella sp.]
MGKKVVLKESTTALYKCRICGYVYSPEKGDEKRAIKGIPFERLPDNWRCPVCYYPKSHFYQIKKD